MRWWAAGRGPRPRGEMTGWGGHHRPPLRPRGRAERCGGFAGFVAYPRGARRAADGCGREEKGRGGGGRRAGGGVMARAPRPVTRRRIVRSPCRGGRGRPRLRSRSRSRSRAAWRCAVSDRDGWWLGGWRAAAAPRLSSPVPPVPGLIFSLTRPRLSEIQLQPRRRRLFGPRDAVSGHADGSGEPLLRVASTKTFFFILK